LGKVEDLVREGRSAEHSLGCVVEDYVRQFEGLGDDYMRERALDIKDIGQRVLRCLLGVHAAPRKLGRGVILVVAELVLSDLLLIDPSKLKGLALATGGVTSHASILARSLEIPTVIGLENLIETVREGDQLVVDGNSGIVYVNPPADIVREYERLDREYRAFNRELGALVHLPAETIDGRRVTLYANIGLFSDVHLARQHGAEGIGLYRTELPFLSHRDFLTEEEQVDIYVRMVEAMEGRPVTIRTLDLGADKYPTYLKGPREDNPFLGWRSIRISLEMADVFRTQLRAILRASSSGPVRILFPMISSVEEIRRVKEILDEARYELRQRDVPFDDEVPIGIMIEVPSAVSLAPRLIHEVDFFSIGTNDLIQYTLAVDRNNRKVASLYQPLHPAVLRAINYAARAAREAGKPVSICGEMAADPMCTLALVGIGMETLSMGPFFVPVIKRLVRAVDFRGAQRLAQEALELATVKEVKGLLFEGMRELGVIDVIETYH
jgi:phosphotransferase system, enzyme I, PtsP